MKIGFLQMTPVWGAVDVNLQTVMEALRGIEADLIVLPEFFNTGYLFVCPDELSRLAESIPDGFTTQMLTELSRNTGISLIAGLPEIADGRYYNSAVLTTPDGKCHLYRKTHLFDRENLYFDPGNTGLNVFQVGPVNIGVMICFDWFFPECARILALKGADIIAHPSNLVLPYCPQAMITRCLENHVFAITCNRAGEEIRGDIHLEFIGSSRIIDPHGEILGSTGIEKNKLVITDIDPLEARNKNITSRNHLLLDRRVTYYQELTK